MFSEEEETQVLSCHVKMQGEERRPSPREPTDQCENAFLLLHPPCGWYFIIGGQTD